VPPGESGLGASAGEGEGQGGVSQKGVGALEFASVHIWFPGISGAVYEQIEPLRSKESEEGGELGIVHLGTSEDTIIPSAKLQFLNERTSDVSGAAENEDARHQRTSSERRL
jgi:hypothetical protein